MFNKSIIQCSLVGITTSSWVFLQKVENLRMAVHIKLWQWNNLMEFSRKFKEHKRNDQTAFLPLGCHKGCPWILQNNLKHPPQIHFVSSVFISRDFLLCNILINVKPSKIQPNLTFKTLEGRLFSLKQKEGKNYIFFWGGRGKNGN